MDDLVGIGELVTAAVSLFVAAVSLSVARRAQRDSRDLARIALRQGATEGLQSWSRACLGTIAEAVRTPPGDREGVAAIRARLSRYVDEGRVFFPVREDRSREGKPRRYELGNDLMRLVDLMEAGADHQPYAYALRHCWTRALSAFFYGPDSPLAGDPAYETLRTDGAYAPHRDWFETNYPRATSASPPPLTRTRASRRR